MIDRYTSDARPLRYAEDGEWVPSADYDAERLRADRLEAELKTLRENLQMAEVEASDALGMYQERTRERDALRAELKALRERVEVCASRFDGGALASIGTAVRDEILESKP